jgi:hypothetical protein
LTPARGAWTKAESAALARLGSPAAVQSFLDGVPYSTDPFYRCPRRVLHDRSAHCFDGAVFAAAALARLGFEPSLLDMRAVRDDDHVLALFRKGRCLGAVAKSNFVGLRFREPIYRSLRELVMSYFEPYYNTEGEKTLRSYSVPLRLRSCEALPWRTEDAVMEALATRLDRLRHIPLLTQSQVRALSPVDARSFEAGMVGTDPDGLYRPG